jgi:hypothetical protein
MKRLHLGIIVFIWALTSNLAFAVTINSSLLNDFEDNSTHGWKYGGSAKDKPEIQPKVVQDADGNRYLEVISTGGEPGGRGPGSRMTFINETEWRGNYNTAGVGSIQARMKNMGDETLYMRVGFTTRTIEEWHFSASETYLELPADSQWYDLSFAINKENITPFFGSEEECCFTEWDFDEVVGGVNQLKFHNGKEAHFWAGERISSVLGVDDIRVSSEVLQSISLSEGDVATVSVPAAAWFFMTGLLGVAGISKKHNNKQPI